ncbi:MAG TPA: hypothetical protein VIG50_03510 [Vicinamibacteria bacterium]
MSTRSPWRERLGRRAVLALALAVPAPASFAQARLEATVAGAAESFSAEDGAAQGQSALAGGIAVEYALGSRGRLFYELDAGDFSTPGAWTYAVHRAGGVSATDLGGGARLFLGLDATLRANGEAWSAADFRALGALMNLELRPAQAMTAWLGYRIDSRRFPDLPALDQLQHGGHAGLRLNLPSRTTVIAQVHVGGKSYEGEPLTIATPSFGAFAAAAGGGRRGMGPGLRPVAPATTAEERAGQVHVLARLAQSLADRTGVSVQVWSRQVWGGAPPALVTTPALFFDDGVYDDPFASDAWGWRAALKHVRPGGAALEASVDGVRKEFTAALALGADGLPVAGGPLRSDRILRAALAASLPLLRARTGAVELDLQAGYDFTRQRSNDAFYRYTAHGATLGVAVRY